MHIPTHAGIPLSDIVQAARIAVPDEHGVLIQASGGGFDVADASCALPLNDARNRKFRAGLIQAVMNELAGVQGWEALGADEQQGVARQALAPVLERQGGTRSGVPLQALLAIADDLQTLPRAPAAGDAPAAPSGRLEELLGQARANGLVARAIANVLGQPARPQAPAPGGAAVRPRDPQEVFRDASRCKRLVVLLLQLGAIDDGELRHCMSRMHEDPPSGCSGMAAAYVQARLSQLERLSADLSNEWMSLALALRMLNADDLSQLTLSDKAFRRIEPILGGCVGKRAPVAGGPGAGPRKQRLAHALERRAAEAELSREQVQAADGWGGLPCETILSILRGKAGRRQERASAEMARPGPTGNAVADAIASLVDDLDRADKGRRKLDAGALYRRLQEEAQVVDFIDSLLTPRGSGVEIDEQFIKNMVKRIGADAEHPATVLELLEMDMDCASAGAWGPDSAQACYNSAKLLAILPAQIWRHVYWSSEAAERMAYWHEVKPAMSRADRSDAQSCAKFAADLGRDMAAVLETVRGNARLFERFLQTELAADPGLFHVDRAVLVRLWRDAGGFDEPVPADEAADAAAASEAAPSQGDAESKEEVDLQAAPLAVPPAEPQSAGLGPRQGGPAVAVQGLDYWPRRPHDNRLALPRHNDSKVKRKKLHHDGSLEKWRSKPQRRLIALANKAQLAHAVSVLALRRAARR
jgi:hypothetical protein